MSFNSGVLTFPPVQILGAGQFGVSELTNLMRFVLVDAIRELEPLKRIVATKKVSSSEDYFPDHFPGYPVVPGVLLVEMIAQAAGKCLMAGIDKSLWPVFLQIRQANFRRSVRPESLLVIEAVIETCNEKTAAAKGKVLCEGHLMADASILLGFISRSFLEPGYEDPVLQVYALSRSRPVPEPDGI